MSSISATINGVELQRSDLEKYRVQTDLFDLNMEDGNIFNAPKGSTRAASDGYFLFIKPPPNTIEKLVVRFLETTEANPLLKTNKFSYDVTTEITFD
jgi:hypothetical protein